MDEWKTATQRSSNNATWESKKNFACLVGIRHCLKIKKNREKEKTNWERYFEHFYISYANEKFERNSMGVLNLSLVHLIIIISITFSATELHFGAHQVPHILTWPNLATMLK